MADQSGAESLGIGAQGHPGLGAINDEDVKGFFPRFITHTHFTNRYGETKVPQEPIDPNASELPQLTVCLPKAGGRTWTELSSTMINADFCFEKEVNVVGEGQKWQAVTVADCAVPVSNISSCYFKDINITLN